MCASQLNALLSGQSGEETGTERGIMMLRKKAALIAGFALLLLPVAGAAVEPGEGFVDVTGGKVWYRIVGSGPATPVLLLHGGPGFTSHYLEALGRLADERPVVFYDQLGAGRSERPEDLELWKAERFVEELAQLRAALELETVHLLGHSWGTMLAVDYLLTNPKGIRSVVLSSPALSIPRWLQDTNELREGFPPEIQEAMSRHEKAGTTDSEEYQAATMAFYQRHVCRLDPWPKEVQDAFAGFNPAVYGTMWGPSEFHATGNLKSYDRTDRLNEISIPVLLTAGRYDEATPETTRWYHELLPGSSLVIFEDSSHLAMVEEPDRYVDVVRQFFRTVENSK
jgi:proline iminopeptidase